MVKKSAQAYRNITEASELVELKPHVLRFWESKFEQLRPMKRGGGRRFYSPDDIAMIEVIKELHYNQGMTIKAASRLIDEHQLDAPKFTAKSSTPPSAENQTKTAKKAAKKSKTKPRHYSRLVEIDQELSVLEARADAHIARFDQMIKKIHGLSP